MIEVRCGKDNLSVSGHAGAAEYGHDLVCAAVSALVLTLSACVEKADGEKRISVKGGSAEIYCPSEEKSFAVIETGLKTIESMAPEFVKVYSPERE